MSFEPFAVQCWTCGSRLRVTDPAIVGTIAACPKCNSMVQIERPAPVDGDAPGSGSGVEATEGQTAQAPTEGGESLRPRAVAVGSSGVDSQAITEDAIAAAEAVEPTDARGFAGVDKDASVEGAAPPEPSSVPPDWQSQRTRRSRQIALVALVSISGLVTAIALFSWFVHNWRRDSAQADATSSQPRVEQPTDLTSEADTKPLSNGDEQQSEEANSTLDPAPTDNVPGTETVDPRVDPEQVNDVAATDQAETDPTLQPDPATTDPTASLPIDLLPQSPIDDPIAADDTAVKEDDDSSSMQQLPPELEKYTKFLLDDGVAEKPTLAAPPTMDDIEIDAAAEDSDDPLLPPKPKQLNLKADLGIRLALSSEGYPLADLMLLVSQMTGVPIQLDWVSFDLAGVDMDASVKTVKGWQTAQQLLDKTAAALGAELRPQQSLVILTLSDESFEQRMQEIADLSDFGEAEPSARATLNEFFNGKADAGELVLGQSREEQQLVALAIESLRRMRGLAPKVSDSAVRHWAASAENNQAEWPLVAGGDAGPQLDAPITLAGFLRRSAKSHQATCIVNWFDANRRGAAPEYLFIPHAEADAATTLNRALSPFELQVRQVDSEHWWVGTEATYDRLTVLVWTPPLGEARGDFTRRMESIMGDAPRDIFRMSFDQPSDRALLLLPRYIVRQLPKIAPAIAAK